MRVEILTDPGAALRGRRIIDAMIAATPAQVELTVGTSYIGSSAVLMMYGTGHPIRRPWWRKQLERGGRCIGWDLGYWKHKADDTCRMRVTIDDDHPQRFLRPAEPPQRWDAEGIALRSDADPAGPVVVVGMGRKAQRVQGLPRLAWENAAVLRARCAWPQHRVVFRPKRMQDGIIPGVPIVQGEIDDVLRGASLVVCRHSNVAVDACIAGVPVVCEDGAAAALYGSDITRPHTPSIEHRLAFLQSLAWWQWKPEEAKEAWTFLLQRLCA